MADFIKKITGLFSNSKTRILVLVAALIIVILTLWGVSAIVNSLHGPLGPESSASVGGIPNIESTPGDWGGRKSSPEYIKQVKQRNVEQAKKAQRSGTSAVPTLTESRNITEPLDPNKISSGVGFTDLKKLEEANPDELKAFATKCKAAGNLVFDKDGNTTGTVAANGEVKDPCGRTIGKVDENCNVLDANGKVIGKAGNTALGTAIYDAQGRLIGTVGPDGLVRDLTGKVIGKVDANGVLRDLNGEIIPTGTAVKDTLVYDENGNVIGVAGADGVIRDANGKVIGTLGADGIARGANGEIIGKSGKFPARTLVYDKNGKLIGVVGPDGKVRDANGNVIGVVGPDGTVKNLKGEIIGKVGANVAGAPVYDSSGRLIGTVGPDGLVRDANGNVIGTVGPDGIVRNMKGEIIGKAGAAAAGEPVYDENGNLIGTVGPDGLVRDAKGNVIGKLDPKTGQVLNNQGKVIGKLSSKSVAAKAAPAAAKAAVPSGTPVYDKNGKLLGIVGPDGIVRDANGNVIGTVGPDGLVRSANGEIIGKAGTVPPGTQIFDENGNVIGTVGADGMVRDANGNVIGMYDPTAGTVIDKQGRIVGKAAARNVQDPLAALTKASSRTSESQLLLAKQRQDEVLAQQQMETNRQQIQAGMSGQLSQLFAAWAPPTQQYVVGNETNKGGAPGAAIGGGVDGKSMGALGGAQQPVLAKAGTIMFAVLDTSVNTDQPGPVMATIVSGRLKGSKIMGTVQRQTDKALLNFNVLNSNEFPRTVAINAVAIDPETARTAIASNVDNHYMLRYGTLFATSFIQGYATALTTTGTTIVSLGLGGVQKTTPDLSAKGKMLVALGNVGAQYSSLLAPLFNTPPTVTVDSGASVGILFLSDLNEPAPGA